MALEFRHTCPTIDRVKNEILDEFDAAISSIYDIAPQEVKDEVAAKQDDLFNIVGALIEELREINSEMRQAAENQLQDQKNEAQDEIDDLKAQIEDLQHELDNQ